MTFPTRAALAAACTLSLLVPAQALAGPTVTIRVEATSGTLVPQQQITLGDGVFRKNPDNTQDCRRDSRAGAVEVATAGDWGGAEVDGLGQAIERIKTVTLPISGNRYWGAYVNRVYASNGNCDPLQNGDELVLSQQCFGGTDCFNANPLWLAAPQTAKPGVPFSAKVTTTVDGPNYTSSEQPFAGATLSGGGASGTTGADGTAAVTLTERGPVTLTASAPDRARHAVTVCVSDGADGFCGNPTPSGQVVSGGGAAPAFAPDLIAPRATIASIRRNQAFSRAKAPRVLKGEVDEANGVLMVKVRLTRTYKGRCSAYSGKRERWIRRPKCGASSGWWFKVGDRAEWEYQLASKLPPGRYVLDVNVIDKAYNRDDARRPGENRVVFTVS